MDEPLRLQVFKRETLIKGQPAELECVEIGGQTFSIARGFASVLSLEDQWYEDVKDPSAIINALRKDPALKPDIFTFWQRIPDLEPKHPFYTEWESIAVLPVSTFNHWWTKQISSRTRNLIRKAQKGGVEVRETVYDDDFVRGMTDIFNEAPVRQGKPFWHYGKDFETIKHQFARHISREEMIAAYYGGKMIGFIMLGNAGRYALMGQIISKLEHRDKATNNALIAKAVELCEKRQWPYLVYLYWNDTSLAEFKRRCGFQETKVPRYFVPLTTKGKLALKLGLHHGWSGVIPDKAKNRLKQVRKFWFDRRTEHPREVSSAEARV